MRCLSAIVTDSIDTGSLVEAKPADLVAGMSTLKQAMHAAIDFLGSDLRVKNVVFLTADAWREHCFSTEPTTQGHE